MLYSGHCVYIVILTGLYLPQLMCGRKTKTKNKVITVMSTRESRESQRSIKTHAHKNCQSGTRELKTKSSNKQPWLMANHQSLSRYHQLCKSWSPACRSHQAGMLFPSKTAPMWLVPRCLSPSPLLISAVYLPLTTAPMRMSS